MFSWCKKKSKDDKIYDTAKLLVQHRHQLHENLDKCKRELEKMPKNVEKIEKINRSIEKNRINVEKYTIELQKKTNGSNSYFYY
nr:hypothetical protein [Microctonus hyperodae filamentous virus]